MQTNWQTEPQRSTRLLQAMLDHAHMPVAYLDPQFDFVMVNQAYARTNGKDPEHFPGINHFDLYPDAENEAIFRRVLETGEPHFAEAKAFAYADNPEHGTSYWDWSLIPVTDPAGAVEGLVLTLLDVTRRHRSELVARTERDFAEGLIDTAQAIILVLNTLGRIVRCNPYLKRLSGYQREEIRGRDWFSMFIPQHERARAYDFFRTAIAGRPTQGNITPIVTKSGEERLIEWHETILTDTDGDPIGLLAVGHDISDRLEVEKQRHLATSVLRYSPEGVVVTDRDLRIVSVNPAFTRTTGYEEAEAIGMTPSMLKSGRHEPEFYHDMWDALNTTDQWQGEIWNRRKNGEIYPEWLSIHSVRDNEGILLNYVAIFSDLSAREHIRKRLHNLAYFDALTGLPNRELFQDRFEVALKHSERRRQPTALMFVDLDGFKKINDTLGHNTGDGLLKAVAKALQECVRASDTVARMGGDEFTIIAPSIADSVDAATLAEKVLLRFGEPFDVETGKLFVGASIGISLYPADGQDVATLVRNADTAMYRAKDLGRSSYQFYTAQMSKRLTDRLALENDLREALAGGALYLSYQPVVNLRDGRITGVEALARWQHPLRGPIAPEMFISVAEESNLIRRVTEQVLHMACRQAAHWRATGYAGLRMSVNLSGWQLKRGGLPELVREALEAGDGCARNLELELTEGSLLENRGSNLKSLETLTALGVQLTIDDFGTGYSSLTSLQRLNIGRLKIDRSFVQDLETDRHHQEITRSIIALAHNLNLTVVAEGVETPGQLEFLRRQGCDEYQGYLFSPPVPAEGLETLLAAESQAPAPTQGPANPG